MYQSEDVFLLAYKKDENAREYIYNIFTKLYICNKLYINYVQLLHIKRNVQDTNDLKMILKSLYSLSVFTSISYW